ncbi:hypothetical protein HAV15_008453 [Penicillium sp. str. |nr:hypothetical protein HAV15_008453 [Penicillium sp. str. \
MSTPTPTQADNLPPFDIITIVTRNDASSVWGFKHWMHEIQLILTNLNLLAIISRDIPRPTRQHPQYQTWLQWSQSIGHWLVCNVTERNSSIIVSMHRGLQLADEMWHYIGCLQWIEEEITRRAEFSKLWAMTRDQFDSLHGYISAWGAHAKFCAKLDHTFNWYTATKVILGEIKEELPHLHNMIDRQIRTGDASGEQFQGHLTGILNALKERN